MNHSDKLISGKQQAKQLLGWISEGTRRLQQTLGPEFLDDEKDPLFQSELPYLVARNALEQTAKEGGKLPLTVISDLDRMSQAYRKQAIKSIMRGGPGSLEESEHYNQVSGHLHWLGRKMLDANLVTLTVPEQQLSRG